MWLVACDFASVKGQPVLLVHYDQELCKVLAMDHVTFPGPLTRAGAFAE